MGKSKVKVNLVHFNDKNDNYKSLNINATDENDKAFFTIREGNKKKDKKRFISLCLTKQELAYLIMQGTKLYNDLDEEDSRNKKSSDNDDDDDDDEW